MIYSTENFHWPIGHWGFQLVGPKNSLFQSLIGFKSIMPIEFGEFASLVHAWFVWLEENSLFETFDRKDNCD